MKLHRLIATVSLLLNAALLIEVYFREWREIDRFVQDGQVSSWAGYAGAMQAESDFGRGIRRLYRPTAAAAPGDRSAFTGTTDGAVEVWAWVYHAEAARIGADSFAGRYNETMRQCLAGSAAHGPPGPASRPAHDCNASP